MEGTSAAHIETNSPFSGPRADDKNNDDVGAGSVRDGSQLDPVRARVTPNAVPSPRVATSAAFNPTRSRHSMVSEEFSDRGSTKARGSGWSVFEV